MKSSNFTSISCLQNYNFAGLDGFQSTASEYSTVIANNNMNNGYVGTGVENDYVQQLGYGSVDFAPQFSYVSPVTYANMMPTPMENLSLAPSPLHLVDYQWNFPCHDDSNKTVIVPSQSYKPTIKDVRKCVAGAKLAQRNGAFGNMASLESSRTSKKRKMMIEQFVDARKFQMEAPIKRSQKLSDKISALQELVSPYGKTDTASVLQEACIYIKIIHQEIRRLSISYLEVRSSLIQPYLQQAEAERQSDLQSKGLCLVPVSIMKTITRESWAADHQSVSRNLRRL